MPIGVLKIPLGASLRGSTKRLHADLMRVALRLNEARNGALWAWMSWCKANGYAPTQQVDDAGEPKIGFRGRPRFQYQPLPAQMPIDEPVSCRACKGTGKKDGSACVKCEGRGKKSWLSGSGWLYRQAVAITPDLPGAMVSAAVDREWKRLGDNTPRDHAGKAGLRWQAYLLHECQLPNARGLSIPIGKAWACIVYEGIASRDVQKALRKFGESGCVLVCPIFGLASGRKDKTMVVRLRAGALTPGHRSIIKRVIRGEWGMCDSQLVYHDNDRFPAWHLHLVYDQPALELKLNKEREARFFGTPAAERPFRLECAEFGRPAGMVRTLIARRQRLEDKRLYLRNHYRDSEARRGHGRNRVELTIRPITRRLGNLLAEFRRKLAKDVIEFCIRNDCGKVVYHEPGLGSRQHSWFAKNGLDFNWTGLNSALTQACAKSGIELVITRERQGADKTPGAARETQLPNEKSHALNGHAKARGAVRQNGKALAKR